MTFWPGEKGIRKIAIVYSNDTKSGVGCKGKQLIDQYQKRINIALHVLFSAGVLVQLRVSGLSKLFRHLTQFVSFLPKLNLH